LRESQAIETLGCDFPVLNENTVPVLATAVGQSVKQSLIILNKTTLS
jgi:hypothetical protein